MGIRIVEDKTPEDFQGASLRIEEINLSQLQGFFQEFESLLDVEVMAIAVQDHGVSLKGTISRRFRLQEMRELLEEDPRPESLDFMEGEIPPCFLRMKSTVEASKRQLPEALVLVMDTAPAAIVECL